MKRNAEPREATLYGGGDIRAEMENSTWLCVSRSRWPAFARQCEAAGIEWASGEAIGRFNPFATQYGVTFRVQVYCLIRCGRLRMADGMEPVPVVCIDKCQEVNS